MSVSEPGIDWRKRYLNETTALDPSADPAALLRLRRRLIAERTGDSGAGASATGSPSPGQSPGQTAQANAHSSIRALETLRASFFQLSDDRLHGLLDKLHNSEVVSIQMAEKRLRVVAEHRKTLLVLCQSVCFAQDGHVR